jgi:tetratricopeptide (TPR) repeat protein
LSAKPAVPDLNTNKADAAHTEPMLKWTPADFSASSEPLPKLLPKDIEHEREWIVRYLLEKVGGTISVNSIPALDENAWYCARLYDAAAKDAAAVLKLVAQHLLIADHLLMNKDILQRRQGLVVAVQTARCARSSLKDMLLATAITDVYVLPNLDAADEREWVMMSKSGILEDVIATYSATKDSDKLAAAYQLFIEHAPQHRADAARLKLAQLYQKQGQREKALEYLNEIKPTGNVRGGRNSIPRLQGDNTERGDKRP